jgi:hypothetical protein
MADHSDLRDLPVLTGMPTVYAYNHELVRAAQPQEAKQALLKVAQDLAPYVRLACQQSKRGHLESIRTRPTAYATRKDVALAEVVSQAEHYVDVLTTNVSYFLSSEFHSGLKAVHPFMAALRKGAAIRIVTMDPESIIAEYRAKQLNKKDDIPGYRDELRKGIIYLYKLFEAYPNFSLHLYDDLPLQITTRVDQTIITSVVTKGDRARKRIQIEFHLTDDGVSESFISHFQSMFDGSTDARGIAWILNMARMISDEDIEKLFQPERKGSALTNS